MFVAFVCYVPIMWKFINTCLPVSVENRYSYFRVSEKLYKFGLDFNLTDLILGDAFGVLS